MPARQTIFVGSLIHMRQRLHPLVRAIKLYPRRGLERQASPTTCQFHRTITGNFTAAFDRERLAGLHASGHVDVDGLGMGYASQWVAQQLEHCRMFTTLARQIIRIGTQNPSPTYPTKVGRDRPRPGPMHDAWSRRSISPSVAARC